MSQTTDRQKANEVLARRKAQSEQAWVRRFQEAAFAVMLRGAATRLAKKQGHWSPPFPPTEGAKP